MGVLIRRGHLCVYMRSFFNAVAHTLPSADISIPSPSIPSKKKTPILWWRMAVSPAVSISLSGSVMYCTAPVFAYKIIWASILPLTDLCHSEDSFTSPFLSLHWSPLNFTPSYSTPGDDPPPPHVQHLHWPRETWRTAAAVNKFHFSASLPCFCSRNMAWPTSLMVSNRRAVILGFQGNSDRKDSWKHGVPVYLLPPFLYCTAVTCSATGRPCPYSCPCHS